MRITTFTLCAGVLLGCGATPVPPTPEPRGSAPPPADQLERDVALLGRQHVEKLSSGDHEAVYAHFDAAMRAAMTEEQLGGLWPTLLSQAGPLRQIRSVRVERSQGLEAAIVTCEFDKALLDVRVVLDPESKITGLFVKPADQSAAWSPPPYAELDVIEEIELAVGDGDWTLPGTLTLPKALDPAAGGCPAVVLVHGSGPHDRDETIGPNKPFKDLAYGLAARGICVLRYEKRTKHLGPLVAERFGAALTVEQETVDDAVAAAKLLRSHASVDPDRVFVLGHSLGGYAIPRIARRSDDARGFIIMAGSTRPLEDLVLEQVRYIANMDGTESATEREALDALEKQVAAVKQLDETSAVTPDALPLGIPVAYWLDLRNNDPAKLIAGETRPLLVLQGDRDYQVTLADYAGWEKALAGHGAATFRRYAELNHLFVPGEGPSQPTEYQTLGHVDLRVIEDIAAFVTKS